MDTNGTLNIFNHAILFFILLLDDQILRYYFLLFSHSYLTKSCFHYRNIYKIEKIFKNKNILDNVNNNKRVTIALIYYRVGTYYDTFNTICQIERTILF